MTYVGSIDFYDGDFELHAFDAKDIIDADRSFRRYVIERYGRHFKEITKVSVCDTRFISKAISEL